MRICFAVTLALAACGNPSGATAPDAQPDAAGDASPTGVRDIPLEGCGFSYAGAFGIGGQTFRLQVDTGSNLLGVAAVGCDTCSAQAVAPLYSPGPTATDLHQHDTQAYGDGSSGWSGELYTDVITAGTLPAIEVAFTAITSQTEFFFEGQCGDAQGIVGLDAAPDSGGEPTNFLNQLAGVGATDEFAMHYCLGDGDLWLDGYDPAATTGDPMWADMATENGNYAVALGDVAVDGTSIGVPAAPFGPALVDSGGPNLLVPAAAYTAITTMVAASPAFAAKFGDATWFTADGNCKVLPETRAELDAELPKLTVQLGSPAISIDLPATAAYLQSYMTPSGMTYCQALYSFSEFTDLGNTLMRAGVVIHDRANERLGIAPALPCADADVRVVAHPPDLAALAARRARR